MHLLIDGVERDFIPIKDLRARFDLPPTFGVAHFQPKDYTGLGSIDRAGAELNAVRASVLAAIPDEIKPSQLLTFVTELQSFFLNELYAVNPRVHLKDVEIEFAAAGFSDMTNAFAYALLRSTLANQPAPAFESVYRDWLNQTVRVASSVYEYPHGDQVWGVQVIAHAYGRIGLMIQASDELFFTYDPSLACPAEGFMTNLLSEVCARIVSILKPL
jgi:hypothetical protein